MAKVLVMGASGFLGSHVVKALVAAGRDVRIMVRATSDTRAIDHLAVERVLGDIDDAEAVSRALDGCETAYYCIVDTRAWLRDPAPLYATNVEGLRRVMDAAIAADLKRFVFTSTYATIGINASGVSTEEDSFNWPERAPDYVKCRVQAENLLFDYCRDNGLPGIACCVGNTYGADDVVPTPHGEMIKNVALGKMPYYWQGGGPCVGVSDAAEALLLAEARGRVGERYIISDRWLDYQDLFGIAAGAAAVAPPRRKIPLSLLYVMAAFADLVSFFTRRDNRFSVASLRCSTLLPDVDNTKARRELGWQPRPVGEAVVEAVHYYLRHP